MPRPPSKAGRRRQPPTPRGTSADRREAARRNDGDASDDEESADSALHGLACLEGDATGGRRKGVQRRDFLKKHRFELSGLGGFYASDALSSTYSYGGALAFYPSEDFGMEVLVTRMPMQFRLEEAFTAFDQQTHFSAHRRLAGNLLAALVAHPRQIQVQRTRPSSTATCSRSRAPGGPTTPPCWA